jgi:hypothetical protein
MDQTPRKCAGNCDCFRSAGSVQVAGRSPLRFIFGESGAVELVECVCGQRRSDEERGVAGLLHGDQLSAGDQQAEDEAKAKTPETAVVGVQDPWVVARELLALGAGMFMSRVSWVVIKVGKRAPPHELRMPPACRCPLLDSLLPPHPHRPPAHLHRLPTRHCWGMSVPKCWLRPRLATCG